MSEMSELGGRPLWVPFKEGEAQLEDCSVVKFHTYPRAVKEECSCTAGVGLPHEAHNNWSWPVICRHRTATSPESVWHRPAWLLEPAYLSQNE
jgi:hypothetical protein